MHKRKTLNAAKKKYSIEKYFSDWYGDYYLVNCFGIESDYALELNFIKENKTTNLIMKIERIVLNRIRKDFIAEQIKEIYNDVQYKDGIFSIPDIDENNVIDNIELLKEAMLYASKLPICQNTQFKNLENGD